MENKNKIEEAYVTEECKEYDLANEEDMKSLSEELGKGSMYFKPETNITYKVSLTSGIVKEVKKEWEGDTFIKYAINIKSINERNEEFEGIWEVGKMILSIIAKNYGTDISFNVTKTGSGKETRYNVVKDFKIK